MCFNGKSFEYNVVCNSIVEKREKQDRDSIEKLLSLCEWIGWGYNYHLLLMLKFIDTIVVTSASV